MRRSPPKTGPNQPKASTPSAQQSKALELARKRSQGAGAGQVARPSPGGAVAKPASKPLIPVDKDGQMIPGTYKTPIGEMRVKKIQPAKNYDVLSFARAMNEDLGPKVKELFEPELEAAMNAIQTGLYISWRPRMPPWDQQDCQRVNANSRCFCGHLLHQHEKFTGVQKVLKCQDMGCKCKAFRFVASRPEEVGEFWLRRRRDFDPVAYRMKCRCKHTHEEHHVEFDRCQTRGCGCSFFHSASVCAACDQHWHEHHTVLETERERKDNGRPVGEDWLPFAEVSTLKNMVLTGTDDGGELVMPQRQGQAPPPICDNSTPFPGPGRGPPGRGGPPGPAGGFRPVYD